MNRHLMYLATLLTLGGLAKAAPAALLAVDVNERTDTDVPATVPGYESFLMTGTNEALSTPTTRTFGTYSVTLVPFDDHLDENTVTAGIQDTVGVMDDRDRTAPVNGGSLTYAQMYDDFIFAQTSNGPTGGMDLTISGGSLMPNTPYLVALYAYDNGSNAAPQPRSATWLDANNGNSLVVNTSFNGTPTVPMSNNDFRFPGIARTDASGVLRLLGRNTTPNGTNGATSIGVFLNGFEVNEIPEPASLCLAGLAGVFLFQSTRRRR